MNMNLQIPPNYVLARDFLNSTAGNALLINQADFISFNKTFCSLLFKATSIIIANHDKEQTMAEAPVICSKIEDMRVLNARLKAKEPVSFYGSEMAKYLEIKPCGKIIIGEYLRPYLYIVNANCSRKLFEANFHDIFAEDYSTIFKISPKFSAKLSPRRKLVIQCKLRVLNNSLDSTQKMHAKRVTNFIKESRLLCAAFDGANHPVLVNSSLWGVAYSLNHACEITRMPTSEAPPLYGLIIHAKGYSAEMSVAKSSDIEDFILNEYHKYPDGHPYGTKEDFVAHTKNAFAVEGKHYPKRNFDSAWDRIFKGKKAVPGWNIKPKAKIDPKNSISLA